MAEQAPTPEASGAEVSRSSLDGTVTGLAIDDVDLRDTSSTIAETCAALSLSLRAADLFAAERLFGFLCELQPDRRLLLADVLQPLVREAMTSLVSSIDRAAVISTCRDLLLRQRNQLPTTQTAGVVLSSGQDDESALMLYMVALLLDEVGVPAQLIEGADTAALSRTLESRRDGALCLPVGSAIDCSELIHRLRRRQVAVVLVGDGVCDVRTIAAAVGASAAAASVSDAADLLLYLRGPLTAAEATVLKLAADGYTNVRMAHELGISVSGVKARLEGSYTKLRAADRTHAVAIALRERWIR